MKIADFFSFWISNCEKNHQILDEKMLKAVKNNEHIIISYITNHI